MHFLTSITLFSRIERRKKKKKRNNYQTRLKNLKKIVVDFWFRTSTKLHEEVASYSTKKKRN